MIITVNAKYFAKYGRICNRGIAAITAVNFQFIIYDSTVTGNAIFTEIDPAITNLFGLATVQIGKLSNLDTVNWGSGNKYLQVGLDITGGLNFTDMGTTQLVSVPYALYAQSSGDGFKKHYVGEGYGGGLVFWVDSIGQHGLITYTDTIHTYVNWGTQGVLTNAAADGIGAGRVNTALIAGNQGTAGAAWWCFIFNGGGYGDWYMPSNSEFNLLAASLSSGNPALNSTYLIFERYTFWTTTETDANDAYSNSAGGGPFNGGKANPYSVWTIRSF